MLVARERQAEMIEAVIERHAGDGDAEPVRLGEVRQAEPPRFVHLAKDHVALWTVHGAPAADTPLEGPPDPIGQVGVAASHLLEDRNRPDPRRRGQQRHDLALEEGGQGVRSAPSTRRGAL